MTINSDLSVAEKNFPFPTNIDKDYRKIPTDVFMSHIYTSIHLSKYKENW